MNGLVAERLYFLLARAGKCGRMRGVTEGATHDEI